MCHGMWQWAVGVCKPCALYTYYNIYFLSLSTLAHICNLNLARSLATRVVLVHTHSYYS